MRGIFITDRNISWSLPVRVFAGLMAFGLSFLAACQV
jgi:hypothetical protein